MTQLLEAINKARGTVRNNMVVLWFPALFNITAAVLFTLAVTVLLMPVVPEAFTNSDLLTIDPQPLVDAYGRLLVLTFLLALILVVANSGAQYMQAAAVKGQQVDTSYFFQGVRKIGVRLLGGSLMVWAAYAGILSLGAVAFAQRIAKTVEALGIETLTNEAMVEVAAAVLPLFLLLALLLALVNILMSMWARVLAIGEVTLWQALIRGVGFAVRNIGWLSLAWGATWLITIMVQPLLEILPLGSALYMAFVYALRVYASVALFHFYLQKVG